LSEVGYGDSVCVLQTTRSFCFAAKTYSRRFVLDEARIQNLDRYEAVNEYMAGAIDSPHPTNTQTLLEPIFVVERLADEWV
jgi:hypothetical protein